ncbi:MAG: DUF4376 domain-containing protein [Synergistes jonesii]|uniref:DUF4376 domain-containing protein n=1 Tax=Synergistes jonesii TaxID=2754 RepID=UPI002A761ABC|nr:DUF4376 domain-containing protein [Synergistes jonesii]MDY2985867.1 DUF4376 domain-containing protein [Synergistes jonesii]
MYKVYVKTDAADNVVSVNSEAFLPDPVPAGWIEVDEGEGDKYHHAQSNYFDKPLMTDDGKYQYRIVDGAVVENDVSPTLDELKGMKRAEMAAARYAAEISGITLSGAVIRTDRESQALITGAALAASHDENYSVTWKAKNGFVTLNSAQIIAVAQAVRAHVEACFDREAELQTAIEAAESAEALDEITWEA